MKKIILASHGNLARGMKSAVEMIVGNTDDITDFNLSDYSSPEEIRREIEQLITDKNEYILVTDIKGGSVCTALSSLCRRENVTLVTTMSLPLVLELYIQRETNTKTLDFVNNTVSLALRSCEVLNKEIIFSKLSEGKEENW